MNKENLVKNISLLARNKSPTPNKSLHSQASFRNINNKSFIKQNHKASHDLSMSPLCSRRGKTNTYRGDSSSIIHTEMSESIVSSHSNPLAEAFRLER